MGKLLFGDEEPKDWYIGKLDRFEYTLYWVYKDYVWYCTYSNMPKILMRKFIEKDLDGDVYIMMEQFHKRTHKSAWDTSGQGSLEYYVFKFEEESDMVAFKLKFGESVQDQETLDHLKNLETSYEKERRETKERGEYWEDRRY